MTTLPAGRLADDEFAFRYLFPREAGTQRRPLNKLECQLQFSRSQAEPADESGFDLEQLFRVCLFGATITGTVRERLLTVILATHCPSTVTPLGYGIHASYPSPRAYYPISFLLCEPAEATLSWLDLESLKIRRTSVETPLAASPGSCNPTVWIKANFETYDPFYNLFRMALFALEVGHFTCELLDLGRSCGLEIRPHVDPAGIHFETAERPTGTGAADFARHRRFARERNSGRSRAGLFPAWHRFNSKECNHLVSALRAAIAEARLYFPVTARFPLTAQLCLRAGDGVSPGIFVIEPQQLRPITTHDPVNACERLYKYHEFGFSTVPAIAFLSVAPQAFSRSDQNFLQLNMALGFVWQRAIHSLSELGLFGRPFRSYDQLGVDILLRNDQENRKAYYGLLIGRNRCRPPTGILR